MEASSPPTHVIPRDSLDDHRVTEPASRVLLPSSVLLRPLSLGWIELRLGNQCIGNGSEYEAY